jgi:hypothetical protein
MINDQPFYSPTYKPPGRPLPFGFACIEPVIRGHRFLCAQRLKHRQTCYPWSLSALPWSTWATTDEGHLIVAVKAPWTQILQTFEKDPQGLLGSWPCSFFSPPPHLS